MKNFNNSLYTYRLLAVCVFILLTNDISFAQTQQKEPPKSLTYKHDYEQIFKKTYWNFLLNPTMYIQKGRYYKDDDFLFALRTSPGFQLGWMINIGLPKHFFIQTGFKYEVNFLSYRYRISENVIQNNFEGEDKGIYPNYNGFALPIYTGYNFAIQNEKNNFFIQPKIGVDLKYGIAGVYSSEYYSGETNDPNSILLALFFNDHNTATIGKKMQFSAGFVAGVGFNYILKDQRILNFQIMGSYNPFIVDKGLMVFLPGQTNEKVIPFRNHFNSIGFEVNYMFSKRPGHYTKKQKKKMEALKE